MNKIVIAVFAVVGFSCSKQSSQDDGLAAFSKDSLARHIRILASDEFQGRRPFTPGETRTTDYLSKSFAQMGLEPGNGTSYFQDVPMVEITPQCDPMMKVQGTKATLDLRQMEDYVVWTESSDSVVSLNKDEVIFVGFGVVAPEYGWNDYAGVDVKGKVVLVMVNDPGFDSGDTTLFKGARMTYYGRWTYKFEEASRQGAKACFIIHNTKAASYPFDVVRNSWGRAQLHLDTRRSTQYRIPVEGWITGEAAKKLLVLAKGDTSLLAKANEKGFKPVPLAVSLSTSLKVKSVFNQSKNVIGKITGSKRPDEYIVYTAHWDHFGIGKPEAGDSIYNGAVDNASGTAALMELARAFKSLKTPPERSIIFLAVTGEEQGLLGSDYYARNPVYPIAQTVANINTDGINYWGRTKDFSIIGAGQSELEDYLAEEVAKHGRYIAKESHPEAGHYFRSDHFSFAKVGVPALTTGSGLDDLTKGMSYGEQKEAEYNEKYYHRPADEYNPAWNLDGGLEDTQLLFLVGKRIAFGSAWPKWKDGSEFKKLR